MKTIVEQSMNDMDVKYLQSQATPEEVAKAESLYDVILCSPTFGNAVRSPDSSGDPNEEFWLKWCINHLTKKGRLTIIVPTGLLSNYSQRAIREFLIADGGIEAIIELPSGWSQSTYPQASILYITRNNDPNRDIKLIRFTKAESIPWNSLASNVREGLLDETQLKTGIGLTVKATDLDKHRLDVRYYHLKQAEIIPPDPKVFKEFRLSELVRISSGERFSKEDFQENGTPFIQVKNVTTNGTLDLRQVQTLNPINALASRGYGKPGDILITTAGTIGKVALIDDSLTSKGVCIDTSLRRLDILDKKQVLPEYLTIFLQTPLAQQQMTLLTTGSVIPVLSSPNLSELIVYLPSITKQREIISLFKDSAIKSEAKFKMSFYSEKQAEVVITPPTIKTPVKEERELPKASWQQIVQSQLPFPIARAYTLFTISEYQSGNMRLKALIDLSESIVYYVYNVLVADQLRRLKLDDAELREKIVDSFTSYSIASRLEVIFRLLNLVQKRSDIDLFVPELSSIDLGVCSAFQNNVRNEWSHTSSFPEHKCRQTIIKYLPWFEKLLQTLLFLKEYNLLQALHITIRNNRLQHHVISMMGNNSLFQPGIEELEKDNILLADSSHIVLLAKARGYDFLDLHPFYLVHAWEQTGEYDHLCFFKQTVGSAPNQRLKVESTQGVGDTKTETDLGFIDLISS